LGGLSLRKGADSLYLEGVYINGDLTYDASNAINYVRVNRCYFRNALFGSSSALAGKNNCSFEECYIDGYINFNNFGNKLLIRHCVISGYLSVSSPYASICNINENALIDGNIFLTNMSYTTSYCVLREVKFSTIQNNIFITKTFDDGTGNTYNNNLFNYSKTNSGNNAFGISYITNLSELSVLFIKTTGNAINYAHDYHLVDPDKYKGTDGTQIGLYGGSSPFKEKGLPSNPQILTKKVATQTNAQGKLLVNFTVKAQEN